METIPHTSRWATTYVMVDVTLLAGTAPSLEVEVCVTDPASGKQFPIDTTGPITQTGKYIVVVKGQQPESMGLCWKVTESATFSVGVLGVTER